MDFNGIKSPDGLLAYHGRPALFYPAVRSKDDAAFPTRMASGIGTAKFLCGASLALLGGMAVYVQAWSAWTYGGVWSGVFALFTGLCILLVARRQRPARPLLSALLVVSMLGFLNTGLLATFTAMGLVAEVYAENVDGTLVWRGVQNASPFVVQLLLLTTATVDSLLSLACCVISGRAACCCGQPAPLPAGAQRRDHLIRWLGAQQDPTQKVLSLPPVRLVPSARVPPRKTPPRGFPDVSAPPSSGAASNSPLVRLDEPVSRLRLDEPVSRLRLDEPVSRLRDLPVASTQPKGAESYRRGALEDMDEKYFALDKKLSEEFIDRTWKRRDVL